MRFLSLRWRLVFSYVFVTALTVLSLGGLALWLLQRNAAQRETEYLTNNAQAVARQVTGLLQSPIAFPSDRYPLQQLATTSAFLGNVQVRILEPKAASWPTLGHGQPQIKLCGSPHPASKMCLRAIRGRLSFL